jgi:thymidylate synthase (FAD)
LKKHGISFSGGETYFRPGSVPWNKGKTYRFTTPRVISEEERSRKSLAASGPKSNFWRGGVTSKLTLERQQVSGGIKKKILARDGYACQACGDNKTLQAHHIVPVYADPTRIKDPDNLLTLCSRCHRHIHANHLEEEFAASRNLPFRAEKPLPPKKEKFLAKLVNVESVTYVGMEPTYDIEVTGKYHNFVCNGMVVHNSQNGLSGRYRTMPTDWYPLPEDVLGIIDKALVMPSVSGLYENSCKLATENYLTSIDRLKDAEKHGRITNSEFKRVREVIRGQLPTAGMVERTTLMNLRSFANYQRQRNSESAQPEIRQVAKLMLQEVKRVGVAPTAIKTLEEIGWDF